MSKNILNEIKKNPKIGVIGLGYVGLPLAVELAKKNRVIAFDINQIRVDELNGGLDKTLEISPDQLSGLPNLKITNDKALLDSVNFYIVTVPTPIDNAKQPDLSPVISASQMLAKKLSKGDVIVYESTVYPGVTEEICVPLLEEGSNLVFNEDFFLGYSPERINPGDKEHSLTEIMKVVSGSTPETLDVVDFIYSTIVNAGTHRAPSIKVAEAAKVIENIQRDINIALINELTIIFDRMNIDIDEVLKAAGTKWNFLPFRPGLVGGHCIGVDPYYLMYKSEIAGYRPEIITAGRRLNDGMPEFTVAKLIKKMIAKSIPIKSSKVLLLGFAFKENCPDVRNTGVYKLHTELTDYGVEVDVFDPWVDKAQITGIYGMELISQPQKSTYDAAILCVAHDCIVDLGVEVIRGFCKEKSILFDLKYILPKQKVDLRL
jgi:UDP-N-acetyl-D-glucosamine/UDP-N-acetyl-D-galactosamine dehydrogenase